MRTYSFTLTLISIAFVICFVIIQGVTRAFVIKDFVEVVVGVMTSTNVLKGIFVNKKKDVITTMVAIRACVRLSCPHNDNMKLSKEISWIEC